MAPSITVKRRVCRVSHAQYRNREIISDAEIDNRIFADFHENQPDTISVTSVVRSLHRRYALSFQ